MQKKICYILIAYMVILCLVGAGLAVRKEFQDVSRLGETLLENVLYEAVEDHPGSGDGANSESDKENGGLLPEGGTKDDGEQDHEQTKQDTNDGSQADLNLLLTKLKQADVSKEDKLKVLNIVKKRLSLKEISHLLSLAQDGVTPEEQNEIKATISNKLNDQDRQELKAIVLKYLK